MWDCIGRRRTAWSLIIIFNIWICLNYGYRYIEISVTVNLSSQLLLELGDVESSDVITLKINELVHVKISSRF